jgi:septum site-determining protein MinC
VRLQIELPKLDKRVVIKGYRTGIGIFFDEDSPLPDLLAELASGLERSNAFFAGAPVTLHLGRREMGYRDFMAMRDLLVERHGLMIAQVHADTPAARQAAERLGLKVGATPGQPAAGAAGGDAPQPRGPREADSGRGPREAEGFAGSPPRGGGAGPGRSPARRDEGPLPAGASANEPSEAAAAPDTLTVRQTLRSGQRIAFPGHVLVLGDINSGAEVVADGDIVVFGAIRGLAHAGARGDTGAVIVALGIQPLQLRIGGVISRGVGAPPRREAHQPEIARVEGGTIVVEAFRGRL